MKDALLVKRSVKLIVYRYSIEKAKYIQAMLTVLSGLNVNSDGGNLLGRKLYAYFDSVDSANIAAFAVKNITCCNTKVRRGTFDVTHLVRDNSTATP